tara:strand:- start:1071 stop:2135 length:1065 start_codon:yes stop_codon:yes gene_type:complete
MKAKPKVTIVVGNGFNIGLCNYLDIWDKVDTRCSSIPCPPKASPEFIPIPPQSESLRGDLWREELWPNIFRLNEQLSGFEEWCAYFAEDRVNQLNDGQCWTMKYGSVGIEYRYYLFYLMYYYTDVFDRLRYSRRSDLDKWAWMVVLSGLLDRSWLRVISYNYDSILEFILADLQFGVRMPESDGGRNWVNNLLQFEGEVPLVKVHGGVVKRLTGFLAGDLPWQGNSSLIRARLPREIYEYPPTSLTTFPDIVLPGSTYKTASHPGWDQLHCAEDLVSDSDLVLFVGWAGRDADKIEADCLAEACSSRSQVVTVLPREDTSNGIRESLREKWSGSHQELVPGQEMEILKILENLS